MADDVHEILKGAKPGDIPASPATSSYRHRALAWVCKRRCLDESEQQCVEQADADQHEPPKAPKPQGNFDLQPMSLS
jgi:hypothetical protein